MQESVNLVYLGHLEFRLVREMGAGQFRSKLMLGNDVLVIYAGHGLKIKFKC